tara:strand:- start:288 stop:740 length:453 start_codon:yes stop_codon:yes gene_type:complete
MERTIHYSAPPFLPWLVLPACLGSVAFLARRLVDAGGDLPLAFEPPLARVALIFALAAPLGLYDLWDRVEADVGTGRLRHYRRGRLLSDLGTGDLKSLSKGWGSYYVARFRGDKSIRLVPSWRGGSALLAWLHEVLEARRPRPAEEGAES